MDGATQVVEFNSAPFSSADLSNGRFAFTEKWKPAKLWDLNTPGNTYDTQLELRETTSGKTMDVSWSEHFGFREFWIDGRDFYLNGKRIYLSAVPLDNAAIGAATGELRRHQGKPAPPQGARRQFRIRAQLRFASRDRISAMPRCCVPPTTSACWWRSRSHTSATTTGMPPTPIAPTATPATPRSMSTSPGNHPSVVAYAMSHNGTGYEQDMNPDMIDGIHDDRDQWSERAAKWGAAGPGDR